MSKTLVVPKVSQKQVRDLVQKASVILLTDIGTPVSTSVKELLLAERFDEIARLSVNPSSYSSAYEFALDYQAVSLLKKQAVFPVTGVDRKANSLTKFIEAENQCRATNENWPNLLRELKARSPGYVNQVRDKIAKVLGPLPEVEELSFGFGPGASSTCKGRFVTIGDKLQSHLVCPLAAVKHLNKMIAVHPHWLGSVTDIEFSAAASTRLSYKLTDHNELAFVPKTALIDRAICIEPHGLVPLQKGAGSWIRNRLRLAGLDLSKQPDVNRHYAYLGSVNGNYATIDLSSASDTISISVVAELLPYEWLDFLSDLRSPFTLYPDGTCRENEKFSSMGNGYTFELETLIFYAISKTLAEELGADGYVGCFGDDIICPTEIADELIDRLTLFGFSVNVEKTYTKGPFRESCGHDYFRGVNVRPYFIKETINYVTEVYRYLNGIRHWAHRIAGANLHDDCDPVAKRAWNRLFRALPGNLVAYGPSYLGDSVIHYPRSDAAGYFSYLYGVLSTKQFVPVIRKKSISSLRPSTQLAVALYGGSENTALRGEVVGYRKREVKIPYWDRKHLEWFRTI